MSLDEPEIRLLLPGRAEDVALVRQALTGLADALRLDPATLADMKTAVSEACNNVVVHAYENGGGPLEVDVHPGGDEVTVIVRDHGRGFHVRIPQPEEADLPSQGVGLSLIQALARTMEISGGPGEGTEVRITFEAAGMAGARMAGGAQAEQPGIPIGRRTVVEVATGPLLPAVLGRVTAMVAARADFSVDRISDAQLVTDAIAAHAPAHVTGPRLRMEIREGERSLELAVGPLEAEGGSHLVRESDLPGIGPLLEALADEVSVEPGSDGAPGEYLRLRIADRG